MKRLARIQPRQWLLIALVMLATGVLTLVLRDAVRQNVVIPMTYAVWLGDIMLRSLPQGFLLGLLVVLCLALVVRSAIKGNAATDAPRARAPTAQPHSRLVFWARQLSRLEDSQFAVEKLAVEFRKLIVNIMIAQENMTEDELIDAVRGGNLNVPAEIRTIIVRPQDWMTAQPVSQWELFLRWLRPKRPAKVNPEQSKKIEAVIAFIEARVNRERTAE